MKTVALRKKKKKKSKKPTTPPNFNNPSFSATGPGSSESVKKKVMSQLESQGIKGKDLGDAMNRGKLTQNASTGKYTFSTDAYSKADN